MSRDQFALKRLLAMFKCIKDTLKEKDYDSEVYTTAQILGEIENTLKNPPPGVGTGALLVGIAGLALEQTMLREIEDWEAEQLATSVAKAQEANEKKKADWNQGVDITLVDHDERLAVIEDKLMGVNTGSVFTFTPPPECRSGQCGLIMEKMPEKKEE